MKKYRSQDRSAGYMLCQVSSGSYLAMSYTDDTQFPGTRGSSREPTKYATQGRGLEQTSALVADLDAVGSEAVTSPCKRGCEEEVVPVKVPDVFAVSEELSSDLYSLYLVSSSQCTNQPSIASHGVRLIRGQEESESYIQVEGIRK